METSYFAISKSNLIIQGLPHWINQNDLKARRLFSQLKATCSWCWCLSVPRCKHSTPKVSKCKAWWHGCPQLRAVTVALHYCSHSGLAGPPWINVLCRQRLCILREHIYKADTYSTLTSMYEYIINRGRPTAVQFKSYSKDLCHRQQQGSLSTLGFWMLCCKHIT